MSTRFTIRKIIYNIPPMLKVSLLFPYRRNFIMIACKYMLINIYTFMYIWGTLTQSLYLQIFLKEKQIWPIRRGKNSFSSGQAEVCAGSLVRRYRRTFPLKINYTCIGVKFCDGQAAVKV